MKFHFTTLLLLFALYSCSQHEENDTKSTQKHDVSSKEKIIKAMEKVDGKEYDERDVCHQESKTFKDLILVGYFAHDRGCMGDKAFYQGHYIDPKAEAPNILNDHNWKKNKEELSIAFTKEVVTAWESVMRKYDIKEDSNTFHVPESKITDDGGVEVICWVREPTGMRPVNNYYRLKVIFDKKGKVVSTDKIGSTSIPIFRDQEEKDTSPPQKVYEEK